MNGKLAYFVSAAIGGFVWVSSAGAASLYFQKVVVKTTSEKTCLGFAADTARRQGLKSVRRSNSEVAGEKSGVYVAVTCVARGNQPAIAIIMSTADNFDAAKAAAHPVAEGIKRIQNID